MSKKKQKDTVYKSVSIEIIPRNKYCVDKIKKLKSRFGRKMWRASPRASGEHGRFGISVEVPGSDDIVIRPPQVLLPVFDAMGMDMYMSDDRTQRFVYPRVEWRVNFFPSVGEYIVMTVSYYDVTVFIVNKVNK